MRLTILLCSLMFLFSCKEENKPVSEFEVNVRLTGDPGQISPFYAATSLGREVYQYIFTPLSDYHPETLELYPILLESLPEAVDTMLNGKPNVYYEIDFLDDAKWSDGVNVSATDYLFTIQMIKHPDSKMLAWKPYVDALTRIELDANDNSRLKVFFDPGYMLSKEVASTIYLMPSHKYDKEGILKSRGNDMFDEAYTSRDSSEIDIVESVNASVNEKEEILQLGPYTITEFQSNEYVILTAKDNYWGNNHPDNVFLEQNPKRIIFRVVPDEVTVSNMAREGKLDFVSFKNSNKFFEMKDDENLAESWSFHTPQLMMYYFIALNNTDEILSDIRVRQALDYLTDREDFIQNIEGGLGVPVIGHFHPMKTYYNKNISPRQPDIGKAEALLAEAGWVDSDGNGIREKLINGKKTELVLDLLFTGSELSKNICLLLQESASKAGIKVELITKKSSLMNKENISVYDYDMAALAASMDIAPDDPYTRWHSDNAVPGTRNQTGYSNPRADELIEKIRNTRDANERKPYYLELQEVMHDDVPVLFLYSPTSKFASSNRLKISTSSKRPGYMANTFKLAKDSN